MKVISEIKRVEDNITVEESITIGHTSLNEEQLQALLALITNNGG